MKFLERISRRMECIRQGHIWATLQHVGIPGGLGSGSQGWRVQACIICWGLRGQHVPRECAIAEPPKEQVLWPKEALG